MLGTKNIVSIMIGQHRGLQADLGQVAEVLNNEQPNGRHIDQLLKKFSADLTAHLELENGVFYVQLLEKMKANNQATGKTEQFIAEMDAIGQAVKLFLAKYDQSGAIEANIGDFKTEFTTIIDALNLRIESEESGVYAYWDVL